MEWEAVAVTLRLAIATSTLLLILGLPLAYWLAFSPWRWKDLIETGLTFPLVLPPTVIGFYILYTTAPQTWLGQTYHAVTGSQLPFTFAGLLLASVIGNLPFAVRPFTAAFRALDRRLIEASWCLGESSWQTFRRVIVPLCWPGILAGVVLTFAHTIGEFGVVLMVGGNIPYVSRTLSIVVYDQVQALDYAAAGRTSLVMIVTAFLLLSVAQWGMSRLPGLKDRF